MYLSYIIKKGDWKFLEGRVLILYYLSLLWFKHNAESVMINKCVMLIVWNKSVIYLKNYTVTWAMHQSWEGGFAFWI